MKPLFIFILISFSFCCKANNGNITFSGQIQMDTLNLNSKYQYTSKQELQTILTSKIIESEKIQSMTVFFQTKNIPNAVSFQKWLGTRMEQEKVITIFYL